MDKIVVTELGVEGGRVTIYGRQVEGVWSFWQEGTSMDLDENDDEVWRDWSSDPVSELSAALPEKWWTMPPSTVHPDFVARLRCEYDRLRGKPGRRAGFSERWEELLGADRPDLDLDDGSE